RTTERRQGVEEGQPVLIGRVREVRRDQPGDPAHGRVRRGLGRRDRRGLALSACLGRGRTGRRRRGRWATCGGRGDGRWRGCRGRTGRRTAAPDEGECGGDRHG